ncbi:MAG: response regulator transcription factor [Propionibacteriaceae bacterium]|jgi:two-component system response regulator RegX3|nr:response regulator transcription factor [Propionibacteriaceae bacterium]
MTTLLLVEDADDLRETLAFLLVREGYDVRAVGDGAAAITEFEEHAPDVVILDLMIPQVSGIEVCRRIRASSDVPIIIVTAKVDESDIVLGLELGADDYVRKPFSTPELLARIRSVLRRRRVEGQHDTVKLGSKGVTMDVERHIVFVDGREVELPLKEFELLELLMRNAERVVTRGQIIDRVWGADYFGDTKTLDVHVRRLRAKIEPDPAHPSRLVTVRGLGYRFEDAS